jgi:hypothetical protein
MAFADNVPVWTTTGLTPNAADRVTFGWNITLLPPAVTVICIQPY